MNIVVVKVLKVICFTVLGLGIAFVGLVLFGGILGGY